MTSDLGNKEVMASNIQKYMDMHNETRIDICKILNTPYTTVTNWLKANTYPRIDKIEMLSIHWGINKSDLIESPEKKTAQADGLSEDKKYLVNAIQNMTEEQAKAFRGMIEQFLSTTR